ncbi:MAG: hypothetical protein AABY22_31220, partial [Nanoarchaeota archaeon]
KNPWLKIEKEPAAFLKLVKKFIQNGFGGRCSELGQGCCVCQLWTIFDILQTHLMNRPHGKKHGHL